MKLAPVVLFVYNRLYCLKRCINALRENQLADESDLIIFSDGYKGIIDKKAVEEVRVYIHTISGFRNVTIIEREKNFGLADSIVRGVTDILKVEDKIIVLEDDLITSPIFLKYMNDALEIYRYDENVASVNGFFVPVKKNLPETFFLNFADCLGWGTWKRAWKDFESDAKILYQEIIGKKLSFKFDLNGTVRYSSMLMDYTIGMNNSWAIRWYASTFLKNKLSLCPGHSLVEHIGNDGNGTNMGISTYLSFSLNPSPVEVRKIELTERKDAFNAMVDYFHEICSVKKQKHSFIKQFVPPILLSWYGKMRNSATGESTEPVKDGWFGNYNDWTSAKNDSTGYNQNQILEKITNSMLKVRNNEAAFERDSVVFYSSDYNYQLLSMLFLVALKCNGTLNVLDFGGSLGTTYYQYRKYLDELNVSWTIVEQPEFVSRGKEMFENENLKFNLTIDECFSGKKVNCILLSSVLQYIEEPYKLIENLLRYKSEYIIIDRTAFIKQDNDRLTVQVVAPEIYEASYPAWFFNEHNLLNAFSGLYELIRDFDAFDKYNIPKAYSKGFLLKLKK